ncbi:MAG: hypothetical protein FWE27_03735 [Defluviitaleaceae bacterium]|nr:hypothetical protein [Defluviitaleaceae bacterium]
MKKIVIIFGILTLLINSVALYFILLSVDSTPQYMIITADINDRSGMLNISENMLSEIANVNRRPVTIDAERAVRIAHMLVLDREQHELYQPYMVFHDVENGFFNVLAQRVNRDMVYDGGGVRSILVCERTGGVLGQSLGRGAGMPSYD